MATATTTTTLAHRRCASHSKLSIVVGAAGGKTRAALPRTVSSPRLSTAARKRKTKRKERDDAGAADAEEDEMAMSFLQFCPTCEKQLVIPSNAVLYCSVSCRRKDAGSKSAAVELQPSSLASPITSPTAPSAASLRRSVSVVPPHQPTSCMLSHLAHPGLQSGASQTALHSTRSPVPSAAVSGGVASSLNPKLGTAAREFLAQFHRPENFEPPMRRCAAHSSSLDNKAPRPKSSSSLVSVDSIAHTAPTLYQSSTNSSPSESELATPPRMRSATRGASNGSLKSLAPVVESADGGPDLDEGLEMRMYSKAVPVKPTAGETTAQGSLKRLLADR